MKTISSNDIPKEIHSDDYDVINWHCGGRCLHFECIEGDFAIYSCKASAECRFKVKIKKQEKKINKFGEVDDSKKNIESNILE